MTIDPKAFTGILYPCPYCGHGNVPLIGPSLATVHCGHCNRFYAQRSIAPQHGDGQAVNSFEANPLYEAYDQEQIE